MDAITGFFLPFAILGVWIAIFTGVQLVKDVIFWFKWKRYQKKGAR